MRTQDECKKALLKTKSPFQHVYNVFDDVSKDMTLSSMRQCYNSMDVLSRLKKLFTMLYKIYVRFIECPLAQ